MDIFETVFKKALKIVSRRMIGSAQMRQKLRQGGTEAEMIDRVIEELVRLKLLNDDAYSEAVVRHFSQKAIGRQKIIFECRKKGIPPSAIDAALERLEWNELERAREALKHKKSAEPRRLALFLRGRGFSDRVIKNLIF